VWIVARPHCGEHVGQAVWKGVEEAIMERLASLLAT
jgi:hypothetical protein